MRFFLKTLLLIFTFVVLLSEPSECAVDWQRSILIYHDDGRTNIETWKRNVMRIDENGKYTGQWLFDHAILTAEFVNGIEIAYGKLSGTDLQDLRDKLFSDARQIEKAFSELRKSFSAPNFGKIKISIALPYIDNEDRIVKLNNKEYHLAKRDERLEVVYWYIDQVRQFKSSTSFQYIQILGLYYLREDIVDVHDDQEIVRRFNAKVHDFSMKSVWVPYYNAPHAYEGANYGFDMEVVQPSYSFYSSIDGGSVTGDRLYAAGLKSADRSQCFEFELRGNGVSNLEYWLGHQYLAIAQFTGANKFPQVFFVGGAFFDSIQNRNGAPGSSWYAYTDLADYLGGKQISNYEVGIPFSTNDYDSKEDALVKYWKVPKGFSLMTSIRLDFNDTNNEYWKGRLVVRSFNNGVATSSFTQRQAPDILSPHYSAVFVGVADRNLCSGTEIAILLQRESKMTPWPNIIRLIAAKYEPPFISNPIYEELSNSSRSNADGYCADSQPTHRMAAAGKLTDGKISNDGYGGAEVMGWNLIAEGIFSVSMDLGRVVRNMSAVRIWTHDDQQAAVRQGSKLTAIVAEKCAPHLHGTLEISCVPVATSSKPQILNGISKTYAVELAFTKGAANGRYVTVSGIPLSTWFLVDEFEVLDGSGNVVSKGAPYKVTPIPGDQSGEAYADNERRLVDGAIFKSFVFGKGTDGFNDNDKSGVVSVLWDDTRMITCAKVWFTQANQGYAIASPEYVDIQIRNANKQFNSAVRAKPLNCGPAPCVRSCVSGGKIGATGVRATIPPSGSWRMVSEISVE